MVSHLLRRKLPPIIAATNVPVKDTPQFAASMKTGTSIMTITFIYGHNVQPSENPKSQHSGSKQRVHGGIENHAIVVMGRIQEGTCPERLFRI